MSAVEYLSLEDLLELVRQLHAGPVRDVGLLDAAVGRSRSRAFGTDAYPSLPLKAAAPLHSIVRNHALADGNKRLAWLATVVFAEINGQPITRDDDAVFNLVMSAAEGAIDVEQIAARLYPSD